MLVKLRGCLQAKINLFVINLPALELVDTSKLPKDEVVFGCTVRVKDLDFSDEETFTLVGEGEEDYDTGKILCTQPFSSGNDRQEDRRQVEIPVPKGTMSFEILEIKFDE